MFVALRAISVPVNSSAVRLATPYRIAVWFVKSQNADTGNAGNQEMKEKASPHNEVIKSIMIVAVRYLDFASNTRRNCSRIAIFTSDVAVGYVAFGT